MKISFPNSHVGIPQFLECLYGHRMHNTYVLRVPMLHIKLESNFKFDTKRKGL